MRCTRPLIMWMAGFGSIVCLPFASADPQNSTAPPSRATPASRAPAPSRATPAANADADTDADIGDNHSANSGDDDGETLPPALTHYMGREIAQTMHYQGAPWLTRESREREEDCTSLLKALGLKYGHVVCDMGCGNGFYSLRMARKVGRKGRVLAVDIQPEMLTLLRERAKQFKIDNIEPILGTLIDPRLPEGQLDLILLVDVYHELSHPEHVLRAMRKALKPEGRMVLAEFRLEDPEVPIKLLHKMSKEQILKEIPPNGFKLVDQYDELPWQHVMFFQRDDEWNE